MQVLCEEDKNMCVSVCLELTLLRVSWVFFFISIKHKNVHGVEGIYGRTLFGLV